MAHFKNLRVQGFKSFVDQVDIPIEQGMTVIVGPNGCGKSNLVEALRWVMGEGSAKKLRGGGMDDLIFSGTRTTPARNIAQVSLTLEVQGADLQKVNTYLGDKKGRRPDKKEQGNSKKGQAKTLTSSSVEGVSPEKEEIEITRRLVRGSGSTYTLNGKDVRAKDIHLLLSDLSSGAGSVSLVGQGKITSLINAKPIDRRGLLEEAAGISGLETRRHEADLRLKATQTTLERLEDVFIGLEDRRKTVSRQVRHAERYKRLSDMSHDLEKTNFFLEWQKLEENHSLKKQTLSKSELSLEEALKQVSEQKNRQAEVEKSFSETERHHRQKEQKRFTLQRELEDFEKDKSRNKQALLLAQESLQALKNDRDHALLNQRETSQTQERLDQELRDVEKQQKRRKEQEHLLDEQVKKAQEKLKVRKEEGHKKREEFSKMQGMLYGLEREYEGLLEQQRILRHRQEQLASEKEQLARNTPTSEKGTALGEQEKKVIQEQQILQEKSEKQECLLEDSSQEIDRQTRGVQDQKGLFIALESEKQGLASLLSTTVLSKAEEEEGSSRKAVLLSLIEVQKGYEKALSAVLQDSLDGTVQEEQTPLQSAFFEERGIWALMKSHAQDPDLPEGVASLDRFVTSKGILARRLAQVALIEKKVGQEESEGAKIQGKLAVGQVAVSLDGALWRWDGFYHPPRQAQETASLLVQHRRYKELTPLCLKAKKDLDDLEKQHAQTEALYRHEKEKYEKIKAEKTYLNQEQRRLEQERNSFEQQQNLSRQKVVDLKGRKADLGQEQADLAQRLSGLESREKVKEQCGFLEQELKNLEQHLDQEQEILSQILSRQEACAQEERLLGAQSVNLRGQQSDWTQRFKTGQDRLQVWEQREIVLNEEVRRLGEDPKHSEQQYNSLLEAVALETQGLHSSEKNVDFQRQQLQDCTQKLKSLEEQLILMRETRVRAQEQEEHMRQSLAQFVMRLEERLSFSLQDLIKDRKAQESESNTQKSTLKGLDKDAVEKKLAQVLREREGLGAVNLCALEESQTLEKEMTSLKTEKKDVEEAVAHLQQALSDLNKEGREKILQSLKGVQERFSELFKQFFGGGQAQLVLTGSDDPLQAGLEVMVSPPGKRLQLLSLLSGGEQTLSALALIFAVFLQTPSPVCILDEADAPLDEANVTRFCSAIKEMAERTGTRFLVVSHNLMTISRGERLLGVTMATQGVSQLVHVDLDEVDSFVQ